MKKITMKEKQREILLSLLLSAMMLLPLLVAAVFSNSMITLIDLLQESSDTVAVGFSFFAIRKIGQGKNLSYNFGYGKLEGVSSLVVSAMLLISVIFVMFHLVEAFAHPVALVGFGVYVGIVSNLIDGTISLVQWRRLRLLLKHDVSPIIEGQMSLFRAGFIASATISIGLLLSLAFNDKSWGHLIDPIGGLILAMFLVHSFYELVSSSMSNLMDKTLEEGLQIAILRSLVLNFDLYSDLYDIRSRRSGSDIYVEVFLGFDPESTVSECMKNIEILRCAMRREIGDAQIVIVPATAQTPQYADSAVGQGEPGSAREPAATMEP